MANTLPFPASVATGTLPFQGGRIACLTPFDPAAARSLRINVLGQVGLVAQFLQHCSKGTRHFLPGREPMSPYPGERS